MAQTEVKKVEVIKIKTSAVCGQCKDRIEEKFNYTKGIVFAELDLESNIVTVKFKTKHLSIEQVKQILADLGYHADEVERNKEAFNALPGCCRDKNASCTGK
jgi:copper chaperone CopZ